MKIYRQIVILLLSTFAISCDNDNLNTNESLNSEDKIDEIQSNYLNFLTTKKGKGSLLIQSNAHFNNQDKRNIGYSRVKGINEDIIYNAKELNENFLDDNVNINSSKKLSQLFGKDLNFRFGNSKNNNSIYIPELLEININNENLIPGTVVNWNIDNQNIRGVAIHISYNPTCQVNLDLAFENPTIIREAIFIEDTQGEYYIEESDLTRFPNNSYLSIDVLRAGFDILEEDIVVGGLTKINSFMKVNY